MNELDRYAVSLENMEVFRAQVEEQAREIAALRKIISECATACGAAVSVECSLEFMAMLPDEIRTVMTGKTREIERLQLTCNDLDDQNDRIYAELAALKAQPSGVVRHVDDSDKEASK